MSEHSVIIWDLETVPDLAAAARLLDLGGATIVFGVGSDPVAIGLVVSLNRPEGNLTGVSSSKLQRPQSASNCCMNSSRQKGRSLSLSTRPTLVLPRPKPERCSRRQTFSA